VLRRCGMKLIYLAREQEIHDDGEKYGLADYRLFHRLWP
jgi:hypothetical protein